MILQDEYTAFWTDLVDPVDHPFFENLTEARISPPSSSMLPKRHIFADGCGWAQLAVHAPTFDFNNRYLGVLVDVHEASKILDDLPVLVIPLVIIRLIARDRYKPLVHVCENVEKE